MTLAFSQTRDQGEDSGASLPKPLTLPGTHPGYVGLPERSLPAHHFHSPDLGSGFPGGSAGILQTCLRKTASHLEKQRSSCPYHLGRFLWV